MTVCKAEGGSAMYAAVGWNVRVAGQGRRSLTDIPVPRGATVLVRGDLWQGTTMWASGSYPVLIDWDCAGGG